MPRLIDADALMQSLGITDMDCNKCAWYDREWNHCKRGGDFEDACCAIENAPTAQPEVDCQKCIFYGFPGFKQFQTTQPKKGKWVRITKQHKDDEQEYSYYEISCSECGAIRRIGWRDARFCPNCGAYLETEYD